MNKRMIMTFGRRCNMQCPFCYGYFDGSIIELDRVLDILSIIKNNGISKISVAGGDPLAFQDIDRVIAHAQKLNLSIDLDTNCYSYRSEAHASMIRPIEYLGIPIDGHNAAIHDKVRNCKGSYEKVLNVLQHEIIVMIK